MQFKNLQIVVIEEEEMSYVLCSVDFDVTEYVFIIY